jgi:hypothetical protein
MLENDNQGSDDQTEDQLGATEGTEEQQTQQDGYQPKPFEVREDGTIVLDGEQLTVEELRADRLRQKDYTHKTQELAEQRKADETKRQAEKPYRELIEQVSTLPLAEQQLLFDTANERIRAARGYDSGVQAPPGAPPAAQTRTVETPFADQLKAANYEDELVKPLQEWERAKNREISELRGTVGELTRELRGFLTEQRGDVEAQGVAAEFKAKGIEVTPAQLREVAQTSGIPNMKAAYLLHLDTVGKLPTGKPVDQAPMKPGTPASSGIKFEITKDTSEMELMEMQEKGVLVNPHVRRSNLK